MNKTVNKNFLILLSIFIVVSFLRYLLDDNEYIDKIIASINVVSISYVFYLVLDKSNNKMKKLLRKDSLIGEETKKKKEYYFKVRFNLISLVIFVIGLTYTLIGANAIVNDIIGFFALFFSLQTKYISDVLGSLCYQKK